MDIKDLSNWKKESYDDPTKDVRYFSVDGDRARFYIEKSIAGWVATWCPTPGRQIPVGGYCGSPQSAADRCASYLEGVVFASQGW